MKLAIIFVIVLSAWIASAFKQRIPVNQDPWYREECNDCNIGLTCAACHMIGCYCPTENGSPLAEVF